MGYSMGYAGTDTEWIEEIPEDVIDGGPDSVRVYREEMEEYLYEQACEKISVWAKIVE